MKILFFLPISLFLILLLSCRTTPTSIRNSKEFVDSKIVTKKILEETAPSISINKDNKLIKMYQVIIYSDRIDLLQNINILIESKSEKFVTATIIPSDLEKIYKTDNSVHIEIPRFSTIH